jgi:hypothetical protein
MISHSPRPAAAPIMPTAKTLAALLGVPAAHSAGIRADLGAQRDGVLASSL